MVREIDENLNLISEKLESESGRNSQLMEEHSISRDTSKINEIAEEYEKLRNDHVGSNDKCKQLRQIVNENISNLRRLSETPLPELKQHLIKNEDGEVEEGTLFFTGVNVQFRIDSTVATIFSRRFMT